MRKKTGRTGTVEGYVVLKPIIVPILQGEGLRSEFAVIMVLDLTDIDKRSELVVLKPRLRDCLYRELLQIVTFRASSARMPCLGALKWWLFAAAVEVVGPELANSLLIAQVHHRALR